MKNKFCVSPFCNCRCWIVACLTKWWDGSPIFLERFLGLMAIALGLFVLYPEPIEAPPFYVLGRIVPQFLLGCILLIVGMWQLASTCQENLVANAIGAATGAGVWFYLAIFTVMDSTRAPAWVTYSMCAAAWLVVLFKMPLEPFDRLAGFISRYSWGKWLISKLRDDKVCARDHVELH